MMSSNISPDSALNSASAQQPAIRIFERLMRGYDGSAALRLWNGTLYVFGDESPVRRATSMPAATAANSEE